MIDRLLQCLAAIVLLACVAPVSAQWAWRDDGGRLVFSDRPPPASVKPSQIVRQPNATPAQPSAPIYVTDEKQAPMKAEGKAENRKPAPAVVSAPKTLAEKEMDARKRDQERAAAEKKASEEQARKQQLAQDCERSRGYLRALEDGRRIAQSDAQGNQTVLDDAARADELARVRSRLSSDCN
jgi:type IV secretory pathway VirB10-like protein